MRRFHWIDILTFAYAAFIVYGSLLPFDFSGYKVVPGQATLLGIPVISTGLPDAMSNIALYLPLGMLLRAGFSRRGHRVLGAGIKILLMAGVLSFCIELLQTFTQTRLASFADVVCNVLGAAVGVGVCFPESRLFKSFAPVLRREVFGTPTAVVAGAWFGAVALTALAPYDVTIDVSRLARAAREAQFTPFAKHEDLVDRVNEATLRFQSAEVLAPLRLWELRLTYVADVFLFVVLGIVLVHHWRVRGGYRWSTLLRTCLVTTAFAAGLTFAGLFVLSVGFDATRILTRSAGGALGAGLYPMVVAWTRRSSGSPVRHVRRLRFMILGAAVLTGSYIVACGLAPFRFDEAVADGAADRIEWVPLSAYLPNKLPAAVLDALRQSFRFVTVGGLIAWFFLVGGRRIGRVGHVAVGVLAALCVGAIEYGQCWLPGRIPAITDVLVAGCGASLGTVLTVVLFAAYKRQQPARRAEPADRVVLNVEIPAPGDGVAVPNQPVRRNLRRSAKH